MTKSELKENLLKIKFDYWRNEEFNRDEFRGKVKFLKDGKYFDANIDVLIDYYNVRIKWYYEKGKKVSKCYSVSRDLADFNNLVEMLSTFFLDCIKNYKIAVL